MDPEIAAFATDLPVALRSRFDALVGRLVGSASTLAADGSIALPAPASAPTEADDGYAPVEAGPTAPGEIPPRYEDVGRLGAGGMGEVRRVRDRELGRTCAYKAIRADLLDRPNVVARFVEEAQIGAQLQHPNIPPIYDGGPPRPGADGGGGGA